MTETFYDFDIPDVTVGAGVHPVVVREAEIRQGPSAPYVWLQLEVYAGDAAGEMLWNNVTLSDKPFARRRAKRDLEALIGRPLGKSENIRELVRSLPGHRVKAVVVLGDYQGEPRPEVQRFLSLGDAELTQADAALAAKLVEDEIPF